MTERLSSLVAASGTSPSQIELEKWGSDAMQTSRPTRRFLRVVGAAAIITSSCTFARDPWATDPRKNVRTVEETRKALSIDDLGWTREHAAQVRARLSAFAEDWDDPEMDIYDE